MKALATAAVQAVSRMTRALWIADHLPSLVYQKSYAEGTVHAIEAPKRGPQF